MDLRALTNLTILVVAAVLFMAFLVAREIGMRAETLWSHEVSAKIATAPHAGEGIVVWSDTEGQLTAQDLTTGAFRWQRRIAEVSDQAVAGGHVVVTAGADLVGLSTEDGREIWRERRRGGRLTAIGSDLYRTGSHSVSTVDPATGQRLWHFEVARWQKPTRPIVHDGVVYFGFEVKQGGTSLVHLDGTPIGSGGVYCVSAGSGLKTWSRRLQGSLVRHPPAVAGEVVVVIDSSGRLHEAHALSTATGAIRWTRGWLRGPPAALGDRILALATDDDAGQQPPDSPRPEYDRVVALDAESGVLVWERGLSTPDPIAPVLAGDVLMVVDGSRIYGISADESVEWKLDTGEEARRLTWADGVAISASEADLLVAGVGL